MTEVEIDRYRVLHSLLDERTDAIRAARKAGDGRELVRQLIERANVEIGLRDFWSGKPGVNWSGLMVEDIRKAQIIASRLQMGGIVLGMLAAVVFAATAIVLIAIATFGVFHQ